MTNSRRKLAPIGVRLYIGNQPDVADRKQIVVSREDSVNLPRAGAQGVVTVTNLLTGRKMKLKRIACGLPSCHCALGQVK